MGAILFSLIFNYINNQIKNKIYKKKKNLKPNQTWFQPTSFGSARFSMSKTKKTYIVF
jgi:hypothetical protein